MGFKLALNINGEECPAAYIKASVSRSTTETTGIRLEVWRTKEQRDSGAEPIPGTWFPNGLAEITVYPTIPDLANSNPVNYAYLLLQAGNYYPTADWTE